MMISDLGSILTWVANSQAPTTVSSSSRNPISLTTDAIDAADWGTDEVTAASNANLLFCTLNADILNANNLVGVQSTIDKYTASLPSSNVYESSYTAPSAQFLKDLAALGSAASAGNLEAAESALAAAKLDAPDNVAGGMAMAKAKGDLAGAAALEMEARDNMTDSLVAQRYSSADALAEANAIIINGLVRPSENVPKAIQERLEQITDLAVSAARNAPSRQHGDAPNSGDPMFNIVSTLIAKLWATPPDAAAASNEALASLDATYGSAAVSGYEPRQRTQPDLGCP